MLYNDPNLKNMLANHCKHTDYENSQDELKKLYELV